MQCPVLQCLTEELFTVEEKVTLTFLKFQTLRPRNIIKVYCFIAYIYNKAYAEVIR